MCERVGEIISHWPKSEWGPVGENSIGVVTPYADQMVRIRAELRKRKLYKINVERVLNVQGELQKIIWSSWIITWPRFCFLYMYVVKKGIFKCLSNAKKVDQSTGSAQP